MSEQAAKKIGFLKTIETNYLDQKKMDVIESVKVRVNEFDERILQKQAIHIEGKIYPDVVPVVL